LFTGIGHDTDQTLLDLVAHSALKTPTAVADFLVQHNLFFENSLLRLAEQFRAAADRHLTAGSLGLSNLESAISWSARARVRTARQQVDVAATGLPVLANGESAMPLPTCSAPKPFVPHSIRMLPCAGASA
jgi:exonuclease VII large subunit